MNIGGKADNTFTGVSQQTFEFDIPKTGDYVIVIYADAAKNADFVLGQLSIQAKEFSNTGIHSIDNDLRVIGNGDIWYDLGGRRLSDKPAQKGIYINKGVKVVMK